MVKVLVIGGGVNGIGTALSLLQKRPEYDVTVVSDKYSPNTTSNVAAGLWAPYLVGATPEHKIKEWGQKTWDLFLGWLKERNDYGVSVAYGQTICDKVLPIDPWWETVFGYNSMNQEQLKSFGPQYQYGIEFSSIFAEATKFLPKLQIEIKKMGGEFILDSFTSLEDAALKYRPDIVMNCSGIASYSLVPDSSVYPVRGQVFRVKAPWQKTYLVDESEDTFAYILPNTETVVVGGTAQKGDWDVNVRPQDSELIWKNATKLCPSLKSAEIVKEYVGLRPGREKGIRVELDDIVTGIATVPVVHNYGHAGAGISLFWGTCQEASGLAINYLDKKFYTKSSL